MTRENSDTFNPAIHFVVRDVPDPDAEGKFITTPDPEEGFVVVAEVSFQFFGRRSQAAKFAGRLQKRLRIEVDASATVCKVQIVTAPLEVHDADTRESPDTLRSGNGSGPPVLGG